MKLELVRKNKRLFVLVLLAYASTLSLIFVLHPYNNIMGLPSVSKDRAVEIAKAYALGHNRDPIDAYAIRTSLGYVNAFSSGNRHLPSLDPATGLPLNPFALITMPFNSQFNGGSFHHAWIVSFSQCVDVDCGRCYTSSFYYVDAFTGEVLHFGVPQSAHTGSCNAANGG